ncbi:hypothetical protein B7463_g3166, partial [Scytalidium lignicola]
MLIKQDGEEAEVVDTMDTVSQESPNYVIDFGYAVPFIKVLEIIETRFQAVKNHKHIGLKMLALLLGKWDFEAGARKDLAYLAVTLTTRMLWFLYPECFLWEKDNETSYCVPEMTLKLEHKGINNRILLKLGWVKCRYYTDRKTSQNSELWLWPRDELLERRLNMISQMDDALAFIEEVFGTKDWLECHRQNQDQAMLGELDVNASQQTRQAYNTLPPSNKRRRLNQSVILVQPVQLHTSELIQNHETLSITPLTVEPPSPPPPSPSSLLSSTALSTTSTSP